MKRAAKKIRGKKIRGIIRTTDGQRFLTCWYPCPDVDELGPDEPLPSMLAVEAAKRLAERKHLSVKSIDVSILTKPKNT